MKNKKLILTVCICLLATIIAVVFLFPRHPQPEYSVETYEELAEKLKEIEELTDAYKELKTKYIDSPKTDSEDKLVSYIISEYINPNLPEFLYFDEYYSLPGTINLQKFSSGQVDDTFTKEQKDITKA